MINVTKREIIFAGIGLASGLLIGASTVVVVNNFKERKKALAKEPILTKDLEKKVETKEPPKPVDPDEFKEVPDDEPEVIEVTEEMLEQVKAIIQSQGYDIVEEEIPDNEVVDEDDEEYPTIEEAKRRMNAYKKWIEENEGVIEIIPECDFEDAADPDDFPTEELLFFKPDSTLTDDDGNILEPIEKWVGNSFDRTKFWTNEELVICVRNFPMERRFKITKATLGYDNNDEWAKRSEYF